jgi:hypothetical protein
LLTDERLRRWLDGNQPQRERLCLGVLALDRRYTQIVPRRPRGGPDGGRDLEAVYGGRAQIWGAVGFRNGACDSAADKRWVRNKFNKDLADAKRGNSALDHFVFFTNVDLTPAEVARLQVQARSSGIVVCDIFCRERLRMLLDSPEGLALRYQYLGIEMSSSEQAAFFSRFGDLLQKMFEHRFDELDRKLERIEFHSECLRPTRYVAIGVRLKKALRSHEIGRLALLAVAVAERRPEPHPALCISVTAGSERLDVGGSASFRWDVTVWSGLPPNRLLSGGEVEAFPERERFSFGLAIDATNEFSRVADFDALWLHLYANQNAIELISSIDFVVNGYVLARSEMKNLSFGPADADDEWLRHFFDDKLRAQVLNCEDGPTSGTDLAPFVFTDFAGYPPARVER